MHSDLSGAQKRRLAKMIRDCIVQHQETISASYNKASDRKNENKKNMEAELSKYEEPGLRLEVLRDALKNSRTYLEDLEDEPTSTWRQRRYEKLETERNLMQAGYEADCKTFAKAKGEIRASARTRSLESWVAYQQEKQKASEAIRALCDFAESVGVQVFA